MNNLQPNVTLEAPEIVDRDMCFSVWCTQAFSVFIWRPTPVFDVATSVQNDQHTPTLHQLPTLYSMHTPTENLAVPPPEFYSIGHLSPNYVTTTLIEEDSISNANSVFYQENTSAEYIMQDEHIPTLYFTIPENSSIVDITYSQNTSESIETTGSDTSVDNCLKKVIFSSNLFLERDCPICFECKKGIVLSCCNEKQFICLHCFLELLYRRHGKTGKMSIEFVKNHSEKIFSEYFIYCPYCFQKTTLGSVNKCNTELVDILSDIITNKYKK